MTNEADGDAPTGQEIAVVGMAGRFPKARDLEEFWRNLRDGVESISRFSEDELAAAGVPAREFRAPGYVAAAGVLEGERMFDAAFFGFSPREASVLNPQHRVFLECAWEALERAGYAAESYAGRIGVYAAGGQNRYLLNILSQRAIRESVGDFQAMLWNADSIATLTSYQLDLRGPSINLQTACSSSLVAVHLACQSLLFGECDMTLAGGIHVAVPQREGYRYQPGGILSPTGECRSFDAGARGTVVGSGVGVVVLKRLEDALADGDTVHAVIRGSAVNNDGAEKAGYTVPRREGQAEVIAEALAVARVEPGELSYVEAHGSGTEVGDPIEVAALTTAYGDTQRRGYCALGSVKSNIGHLDAAAGIAGLIKTVLAMKNCEIPPSLHFETPNPRIDFDGSPFFVNALLRPWERNGVPRYAGISSFGMGGTNAHVVLREAPDVEPSGPGRSRELLVLSARTGAALEAATDRLVEHLKMHPEQSFADVAHTLRVGRRRFRHRRIVVCRDREDAVAALASRDPRRVLDAVEDGDGRPVAFLFPGLGDHYEGMARGLYEDEPVFRREVDRCAVILETRCGMELRGALFPAGAAAERPSHAAEGTIDLRRMLGRERGGEASGGTLDRTELAHPALFVVEYALARTWMEWGVRPEVMLGHSLGEYVAATLAGVFELEEALVLVAERARLIAGLPGGAMLAVPLPESRLRPHLGNGVELAAINAAEMCTVSGTPGGVAALEAELGAAGVACRRLNASHAFHSAQMEPVARGLVALLGRMRLRAPEIPFVSNVTGRPITAAEATDPEYWARHLCRTVRFAEGMREVLSDPERVVLEVGPGRTLGTFARQEGCETTRVFATLSHAYTRGSDLGVLLETVGAMWMAGVRPDWAGFAGGERRLRVPLPTYPFERQAYWIEPRARRRGRRAGIRRGTRSAVPGDAAGVPEVPDPPAAGEAHALQARPDLGIRYTAPVGEAQLGLARIWEELLGFERIGAHDDFFALGGHSLMATRLLFRVREAFGLELPLEAVFEVPTVAGLAERIESMRADADGRRLPPIVPAPRTGPLPLSYAQERLWILDQLEPGSPLYHVPIAMRIRGRVDEAVAQRALTEIVRRHEVLRTVYATVDGGPVQVVLPVPEVHLPLEELRDVPEEERGEVARARLEAEVRQPIDLTRGPVMRTRLLRFTDYDHVLLTTIHHIAVDGWSWGLMFHEWEVLYASFAQGEPSPLPELQVQYADYAVWQREILSGDRLAEHLDYWREALRGAPAVLEIPTDRPHPPVQSYRGGLHGIELAPALAEALHELGRRERATMHQIFLAVFEVLAFRYTQQEDFVVGSLAANRLRPETQRLIGFFVNTLPVRARLTGRLSFRGLLDRVREVMLGVYAHAELPLQVLIEEIRPERDASRSPLLQVVLGVQTAVDHGPAPDRLAGFALTPLDDGKAASLGDSGTSKFDLSLLIEDGSTGRATVLVEYNSDLFDRSTILRLAEHYRLLLEGVAAAPETSVADLPLLTAGERGQLLEGWSCGPVLPPPSGTLHGPFEAQAARTPEAVALRFRGERLTYAELDARAASVARLLRTRGIGPETRVAVCLERGVDLVAGLLGVLRAGGAYVPLDPAYPRERLAFMLADSGAGVLLTRGGLADWLPADGLTVVSVDAVPGAGAPGDERPATEVLPEHLAYVIYTSGSTGRPKGVAIEHRNAVTLLRWAAQEFAPEELASVLASTSVCFDVSVFEIFAPLAVGGTVVLVENALELPGTEEVTLVGTVPSVMAELVRTDAIPSGVLAVNLAGEAVQRRLVDQLHAREGLRVRNLYGPSEDTTFSTCALLRRGGVGSPSIGRPIANTRALVLDRELGPVPAGVPGDLYVAGDGLARGYLGRPDLTAERWVPVPSPGSPGERMYRTGDRVRWRADGELEFLARTDHQVKLRGFRIELGEVESVLLRDPGVRDCAVVLREDVPGERCLAAYLVPAEAGGIPEMDGLKALCREALPEYMVPAVVVVLDALPLTPSGKIDRRALPAPERGAADDRDAAPRTPAEEVLCGIYADVLQVEHVGIHDDFFALGGHSLLATRVVARVREAFGVELPLRAVFETSTVAALAGRTDLRQRGLASGDAPPIERVPREGPLPLSFAQQRLWMVDRLESGSAAYNMPGGLRLRGRLYPAALRASLSALEARHEALRTTFAERDGAPVQVVHPPAAVPLPVLDLGGLPAGAREREAERVSAAEALRPFDLARGPLLRGTLLRLDEDDHVLLFTLHHIVGDGQSMEVLVREVSVFYGAARRGEAARLPDLPIQYADFAVWQRGWLGREVLEAQTAYWKQHLAGAPPLLEIPTDRPRQAGSGSRAGSHGLTLPPGTMAGLRALSRRGGATLFMTLLAGWQALLSKYSGQDDVVVGTPVEGRNRREVEGLIGCFVNMLAMRADLSGDPTWAALLGRVREGALGAYEHQELPFDRLVEELRVERSLAYSPVFQAVFVLDRSAFGGAVDLGGLAREPFGGQPGLAKYDLELVARDDGDVLVGALVYRAGLFEPGTVARMVAHLEAVFEAMAADPRRRLSELSLLRGAERARVLEEWNAPTAEAPSAGVAELFAGQAARTPGALALACGGETLSYAGLDRRVERLARALRREGVGPERVVGIFMEHSLDAVTALLAVLRAGGCALLLDPEHPEARLAYLLEDAGVALVLAQPHLRARLPHVRPEPRVLEPAPAEEEGGEEDLAPLPRIEPESAAYLVYTSGSTGRPKGVLVPHGAAALHLGTIGASYALSPADRVLVYAPQTFDPFLEQALAPLLVGAAAVLRGPAAWPPDELAERVEALGITVANVTPSYWAQLVREREAVAALKRSLRLVIVGGEALPAATVRAWEEGGAAGVRLLNAYGPTEAVVTATLHEAAGADGAAWGASVPIGRGVGGRATYVLDAGGGPVPVGVAGELYLGGAALARGYRGRPGLTAERFVPDGLGSEPGARLYRTGDRVRWRADGTLEYLGRIDAQVKVRGVRIEPGEVEAVLREHAGVREAVVTVCEDAPGEKRLVAYVVPEAEAEPGAAELRAHLSGRLPEHMVPGAFVALERLPLTPSGKIDRRALPAPQWGAAGAYTAPRTPTEEVLAGIWAEVLGLERVGVEESFFELGGHSLLATQVVSRVRQTFGVEVPLHTVFEAPTLAGLAGRIGGLDRPGVSPAPPIERVQRTGTEGLPLSFAQQRLWFVYRVDPGSSAYNMPFPVRLRGSLYPRALGRALSEIVRRHDVLRTVFDDAGGEALQSILPAASVPLPQVDLRGLPDEAREAEVKRLADLDAALPFDLRRGPVLRATLLRMAETDWGLLLDVHHIACDGWSTAILVDELSALYSAFRRGEPSPLAEPRVQYADYAAWQRAWLSGGHLDAQLHYWRGALDGAVPTLDLPTDHPRPPVPSARGKALHFHLPSEASRGLRALCRREAVTPFMVLLAAWQLLLARWTGQEDVSVGTAVAGRNRLELEELIGLFVNTLVVRVDLGGRPTVREVLRRARSATLGAFAHQDVPFEKVVETMAPARSLQHTPLFQVMFNMLNLEIGALELEGVELKPLEWAGEATKFDLSLTVMVDGERFGGHVTYRTDLFEAETVQRMLGHFSTLAGALVDDPDRPAATLPLMGEAERRRVLAAWSATMGEYPRQLPVHALFERQVELTPDAPALVWDGGTLTYAELDARADDLAGVLAGRGVRPEVLVGVLLERGPALVAALLGVLKAGGVYVPLDPTHPAERLAWLIEDSAVSVLLTEAGLAARLPEPFAATVLLGGTGEPAESRRPSPLAGGGRGPGRELGADALAYVVYTSGSTGRPKGVLVTHGGVVNYLSFLAEEYGVGPADTALQLATATFDASIRDILGPLTTGARLVLSRPDELPEPGRLLARIREHGVTVIMAIVPSLLRPLLDAAEAEGGADTLRLLLVSGEPLPVADVRRAHHLLGTGVRMVNQWGATECTMSSTLHTASQGEGAVFAPVGRPILNTCVYVLDAELEPAPGGVPGEAYISTPGIARGYAGRPELTAERFVPDPFSPEPGARMYRMGDRVRWRGDGVLEFLGRLDAQVKVQGVRVEPGEVEAVLRAHPGVRTAAVTTWGDAPGGSLVAYVVAEEGAAASAAELRGWLAERLPSYMVPSAFVGLDALPLTSSGKLDRRALPAPHAARDPGAHVPPRDALELRLAHAWEELLDVCPVGVRDDFFALGGHSLLALRLLAAVERLTGRRLSLATLLAGPTVEGLARALRDGATAPAAGPLVPIQPTGSEPPLFLVHAAGGNVASFAGLARLLGPHQPVYALEARGLEGEELPRARIEDMAADYLAQLRAVRREGPYRLGGWSMGGLVAFEMARMLEAEGEEVELLALLDSRAPGYVSSFDPDDPGLLAGFMLHLGLPPERIARDAERVAALPPGERLRSAWEVAREADVIPGDLEFARFERLWAVFRANVGAAASYRPEPCASDLLLLLVENRAVPDATEAARWASLTTGTVRSATVPGDHFSMVRAPHVEELAARIAGALACRESEGRRSLAGR